MKQHIYNAVYPDKHWIQGDMMDFYFMLSYSPDFLSLYLFPYCYRGRKPSWKHISKQCLPLTLLHFVCL